jgi:putative lipoic acid-binding regulatory protein
MEFNEESFREKLEGVHVYPTLYMFKFIVLKHKIHEILDIFPKNEVIQKPSSNGTYISCTIRVLVASSDHVIDIYKQAKNIEGIISL